MDGQVWILLTQAANQLSCSFRFENTSLKLVSKQTSGLSRSSAYHVLDAENVCANIDDLLGQIHVVLVVVLLVRVQHVAAKIR